MWFYKFIYYMCKIIMFIPVKIILPTKILNKKRFPKNKSLIICSNHLSWMDIILLWVNLPGYRRFVAKKELGEGFKGWLVSLAGTIFVDRENADLKSIKTMIGTLKDGCGLNLFPEGTRNKIDTELQEIKGGISMIAIKGNAKVVPVIIYKKTKAFSKNYINIGDCFGFEEFEGSAKRENIEKATKNVVFSMKETQRELRSIVDNF